MVEEDDSQPSHDRFLVLLRHGIAEPAGSKPDAERVLTPEGHAWMKQISRGLERAFPKALAIYASPYQRAVQTAIWVSKAYRGRIKTTTSDALLPEAPRDEVAEFIAGIPERRVIIVGHEPTLKAIIGLDGPQPIELKTGGCFGLRVYPDGRKVLEWLLSPRILNKLGENE